MKTLTVYLGGFMSAEDWTREWRLRAATLLANYGIESLDPFRGKQTLTEGGLRCSHPTSLITARDRADILRSDVILINASRADNLPRQSIGTWSEYGFAAIGLQKPTIVIAPADTAKTVRTHPFIEKWAAMIVDTVEQAVEEVLWLR